MSLSQIFSICSKLNDLILVVLKPHEHTLQIKTFGHSLIKSMTRQPKGWFQWLPNPSLFPYYFWLFKISISKHTFSIHESFLEKYINKWKIIRFTGDSWSNIGVIGSRSGPVPPKNREPDWEDRFPLFWIVDRTGCLGTENRTRPIGPVRSGPVPMNYHLFSFHLTKKNK